MSLRLLLVRHGESVWNAAGRWQGHADPPLSELGRRQAALAAGAIGAVDAVVSSDLRRASETAEIIATELGIGPVHVEPRLRERDVGEWSGLTRAEIDERWPGYLDAEVPRRPPGWEGDDAVLARALEAIDDLAAQFGANGDRASGEVVAVSHGGLLHTIERHLGAPFARLANLEGRWLHVEPGRLRAGDRVLLLPPDDVPVTVPRQL